MVQSLKRTLLLPALFAGIATAQTARPPAAPQLSPLSAYDQVMRPLDITRRSIANWSDSETAALAIAIKQASEACSARTSEQFAGDDLIAYARLCALGQQWPVVLAAATRYIGSSDARPQLAQAYAYQVNATLHGNDHKAILNSSLSMLKAVPYASITDETINASLHYLQLAFTLDALTLYAVRQPILLAALSAVPQAASSQTNPPATIHALYADGLAYAALQQFTADPQSAAKTVAELDAALPATMQPDDAIPIAESRSQYALLGTPLPAIASSLSLFGTGETARINTNYGNATALFLFPEWCAQCVRLASEIMPTLYRVNSADPGDIHIYALLAQPTPPIPAAPKSSPKIAKAPAPSAEPAQPEQPKTAAELLRGTPTLIVSPATLAQFAATDSPLLIVTDSKGIIRFMQPASETALNPGDFLDQIVMHITKQWTRQAATAPQ